jgi:long-chain fatty acid transport protein
MKHLRTWRRWLVAGAVLLAPTLAFGSGFALFEHGARAVAMAGAFGATADDPTAVYYNPAGLAFLEGTQAAGGFYLIQPTSEFTGESPYPGAGYTAEQEDQVFYPPHAYLTGGFTDRLKWGVGVYAPFGLGTWWPDDFAGRYISKRIDLRVINFNPNVAYKLSDSFAIAAGFDYYLIDLDLTKSVGLVNPYTQRVAEVGQVHIEADQQTAWGYNVALLAKLGGGFSAGASYRSRAKLEAEAKGSFVQFPTGYADFDAIVAGNIPFDENPDVESEVLFPAEIRLGLAWHGQRWAVEANAVRQGWDTFDELPMIFVDYPALSQVRPENYEDSDTYRLGFEYKASERWAFQFGGLLDESPVPTAAVSPLLPDADRVGISAGFSWAFTPNMRLDVGFLHLMFDERSTEGEDPDGFNGEYKNRAELLGMTLVYRF